MFFGQIAGMGEGISCGLAQTGFSVYKLVPTGTVDEVTYVPYSLPHQPIRHIGGYTLRSPSKHTLIHWNNGLKSLKPLKIPTAQLDVFQPLQIMYICLHLL